MGGGGGGTLDLNCSVSCCPPVFRVSDRFVCSVERQVLSELATQVPGQSCLHQPRGDEDEQEEESVYMFRNPGGSPEVNRLKK